MGKWSLEARSWPVWAALAHDQIDSELWGRCELDLS